MGPGAQTMSISLLEELQSDEYETAMFLTYTINLRFFELMILPRLRRMGVSRVGILIDQKGYQDSLADPLAPQYCGREYILAPIHLPRGGIQHTKLIWLQKHGKITAYIGSHNLTMAGFNDQVEVTAKLTSTNPGHIQALCVLHDTVSSVILPSLDYVWKHTAPPTAEQDFPTAKVLSSFDRSLFDQIVETVQIADELRVVTPFLDAAALKSLSEAVHAETILLDLPKEGADTPLLQVVEAVPGLQPRYLEDKRLHAKAYQFTATQTSWLAIGSANCTQAALMKSVAEGGNLEFLLLLEDASLPDENFGFTTISSPGAFPNTGRNWDASSASPASIIIEEAFYKDRQLTVKWKLLENTDLSEITLDVDGESISIPSSSSNATRVTLDKAPQSVTLKATIDGNISQIRGWVINYNALEEKVSQAKLHQWVERIASEDPRQHADSIAIWLAQGIQELLQGHHETESGPLQSWEGSVQKQEKTQSKRQFYEVFAYSSDLTDIRASARTLLASYSNGDPLVLLRVLLIRFAANPSLDMTENTKDDGDAHDATMQHYLAKRKAASQSIVRNLVHQLDRLTKAEVNWNSVSEQDFSIGLRILLGAVARICCSIVEDIQLKDAEDLTEHFIHFFEWLVSLSAARPLMQQPQFKGSFLLSVGAVARIAERCKEPTLYPRLQKASKSFFVEGDLRSIITTWKQIAPEDADRFLTLSNQGDLWQQVEPYGLRLLGIIPDHLRRKIEQHWGLLLALQEADIHSNPQREDLYAQAKTKYFGEEIWIRYDEARRRKKSLPVIFQTTRKVCSACYQLLPERKWQQLRVGEAVICDGCHQILLLKG
jgi:hypothetical protein